MENHEKNGHPNGCRCLMCQGHGHVWHWIIKIVILAVVFWIGFKLGELKIIVEDNLFGPRMMYGNGAVWNDYSGGRGMMGGWGGMMNGLGWYGQATSTRK